MSPRQGNTWLRRLAVALMTIAGFGGSIGTASAETPMPSVAAQIAHAEFLPYMDPPPGEPATVCLVDTGVDLNPDTVSNVVSRVALDGGDGGDVWDRKHGTEMAMVMGAPANDWGTVGAWPLVRIVSVRAMPPGGTSFPFSYYAKAILRCRQIPGVRVINLSFSGPRPTDAELAEFDDIAVRTRRQGISLVAGAGNGGGDVGWPAADANVLAVGANGPDHALCSFSARGSSVALLAPGCALDLADPVSGAEVTYAGTSPAAAFASATIAALRSYRPELSPEIVDALFRDSASAGVIDVEAAFIAGGLATQVDHARSRLSAASAKQTDEPPKIEEAVPVDAIPAWPNLSVGGGASIRWAEPRGRARRCSTRALAIRLTNFPSGATAVVRLYRRRSEFGDHLVGTFHARSASVIVRRPVAWLRIQYTGGARKDSRALHVRGCVAP